VRFWDFKISTLALDWKYCYGDYIVGVFNKLYVSVTQRKCQKESAKMEYEIRTFIGIACAAEGNTQNYPAGEKHSFNLFLKQPKSSKADFDCAENIMSGSNWASIELRKTGVLSKELTEKSEEPFCSMYEAACQNGSALLIYSTPEN